MGYSNVAPGEASKKVLDKLEHIGLEKPGPALVEAILHSEITIEGIEEVLWTINDVIEFFFTYEPHQCLRDARETWFTLVCYCKDSPLRLELDVNEIAFAEERERQRAAVTTNKE